MSEKEKVTLEKKIYDVLLKRNTDLIDENARLRDLLSRCQKRINLLYVALQEEANEKYYLIKRLNELEGRK